MSNSLMVAPARAIAPATPYVPLVELIDAYVNYRNERRPIGDELSPATKRHYTESVKAFSKWLGHEATTTDLTVLSVNAFLTALHKANCAPNGIKSRRTGLVVLMRFADDAGLIEADARRVRQVRCEPLDNDGFTAEQMQLAFEACGQLRGMWSRCGIDRRIYYLSLLMTMWDTSARVGDMAEVRVDKFDPVTRLLWIAERKTGKSGWRRVNPNTAEAIGAVVSIHPNREIIWPGHSRNSIQTAVNRILRIAGLPGTSRFVRRGSASELERLHPGTAWRHLRHSTPVVFERHYRVRKICDQEIVAPPAVPLTGSAASILPPRAIEAAEIKPSPPEPKEITPKDVVLSANAKEALTQSWIGPEELKVLAECLASQGVTQTKLAEWWGYKLKFYQNIRYGYKRAPREAQGRLRRMFGIAKSIESSITCIEAGTLEATPAVMSLLNTPRLGAYELRQVLQHIRVTYGLRQGEVAISIGLPMDELFAVSCGKLPLPPAAHCRLRGLFEDRETVS